MALLVDPNNDNTLYAVGNVETRYAITFPDGAWLDLDATSDGSSPHADNRNLAFYNKTGELLLVSDGGEASCEGLLYV